MKRFICVLCSLVIVITYITGCSQSSDNPFTADDAIKGQIGDLYYVVPANAVLNEGLGDSIAMYKVPIDNSAEEYTIIISCTHADDADEYEDILQNIEEMKNQTENETGTQFTDEAIDDFLGKTIDKGFKREGENNGEKAIMITAAGSGNMYLIGYTVKTGFYDQSVWENFLAQLKLV